MKQTHSASQIKGSIILTATNIPVFVTGISVKESDNNVVATWVSFSGFNRFCQYAAQLGLFSVNNGNKVDCDLATLKALFLEFEAIEQNQSLTSILFKYNIYPLVPEVKALNCNRGIIKQFNFWLDHTRCWLQSQLARVSSIP